MRYRSERDRKALFAWSLYGAGASCLAMTAGGLFGSLAALGVVGVAFLFAALAVAS